MNIKGVGNINSPENSDVNVKMNLHKHKPGAEPGFQVRGGAHLKKLRRMEGGAKILGVFRVKNHDFTPKNHIFSNFRGGVRRMRPTLGSAPASQCSNHHHGRMKLSSSKNTGSPFYLIGTFDDLIPCRGHHDRIVVRFTTTYAISAYHH